MSDRRVLSVSAALITAAIFLFLLGTYPSWRAAIKDGISWSRPSVPTVESGSTAEPDGRAAPAGSEPPAQASQSTVTPVPAVRPGQDTHSASEPRPRPQGDDKQVNATTPAAPARSAPAVSIDAAGGGQATAPLLSTPGDTVLSAGHSGVEAAAGTAGTAPASPTFDIVRVEPTGDSVIAARAKAGAAVVLLDQGQPIARAQADNNGQVAFVPPPLAPGEHSLMLSVGEPNTPGALSSQSVAVSVRPDGKAAPMVALIQPDQPTRVLSDAAPATPPGAAAAAPAPAVSVSAIDVEEMGEVYATGKAAPGSHCRVYLNGSFVASVTAGSDGRWSLRIQHGMRQGHYAVRVDQVGSAEGSVSARAEVPFDYPATLAGSPSLLRPKRGPAGSSPVAHGVAAIAPAPAPRTGALAGSTRVAGVTTSEKIPGGQVGSATSFPGASRLARSAADTASFAGGAAPLEAPAPAGAPTAVAAQAPADAAVPANAQEAADAAGPTTIVAQLLTTKVVRGDSLWRISRKMLGHGRHYTQIYAANTTQIRDPALIYPGQIFVMPHG